MSGSVHDFHWLRMDDDRRIVGCQCGFAADESDEGYGDSVVKHITNEALIDTAAAVEAAFDQGELDCGRLGLPCTAANSSDRWCRACRIRAILDLPGGAA